MNYARHLIERIAAAPDNDRVGVLSNELLREFQRGHPLDDLRQLLLADNDDLVAIAVWIASELGVNCRPLLRDVLPLLAHRVKGVRFWALDCVFWLTPENGCDLARAVSLLEDHEAGIRWKVLDLLSRLSLAQLEAAFLCEKQELLTPSYRKGLGWLLSDQALTSDLVISALRARDPVARKYGVVAAARLRKRDNEPLKCALTLDDTDVKEFASRILGDENG